MAEQAQKQEAKAPERPQVRKVRFREGVFLGREVHEIDLESPKAGRVDIYPGKGLVVRWPKTFGAKTEECATWIPEGMVKQVECAPEWKP